MCSQPMSMPNFACVLLRKKMMPFVNKSARIRAIQMARINSDLKIDVINIENVQVIVPRSQVIF